MDLSDLSLGSSEDEENPKDNSSVTEKSKLDNTSNHFRTSIEKNSNKNEHSQSRLSLDSTDATFGSSSSDSVSSDDEQLDDLEEISKLYEPESTSDLEHEISGLPPTNFENMSDSLSETSFAGHTELINESQTTKCVYTRADGSSSLPGHSPSLKTPKCHADDLPSTAKERSSNNSKTDEMQFCKTHASDKSLQTEKSSSSMKPSTVPPMRRKSSSNNATEDEMPPTFLDCGSTAGFDVDDFDQQKDKSVIRKIKAADTTLPPTELPLALIGNLSRRIGRSLLQVSKRIENTFNTRDDRDLCETEKLSSSMNPNTVPPMPRKFSSSNTEEDEMSDCGVTEGFDDNGFSRPVRRNIKAGDSNFPPTELPLTLITNFSSRIGRSLLQVTKRMEKSLNTDNDRDLCETKKLSSSNTEEDEMSDCGVTEGFDDNGFNRPKDKSVRRNIKAADANLPPTELPLTLITNFSSRIGRSLLQVSKRMEKSNTDNDRDLCETKKLSSSMNPNTVPPMSRKSSSNNVREDEISPAFSDCGATGGFDDNACDRQKDKSVRRKIRAETRVVSDTNLPPTELPSTSDSNLSRRIGRSLLQVSKRMEKTSNTNDDWDFCETYSRKDVAESFTSEASMKEIQKFFSQFQNTISPRLDKKSLLTDVNRFFRRNRVEADENLTWGETKNRIVTSLYFSDEFAREHGLLSFEELTKKFEKDLQYYAISYLKYLKRLRKLCKILMNRNISEKNLIDFCLEPPPLIPERSSSDPSDRGSSLTDDLRRQLLLIANEIGWNVIMDLCKKVTATGESFYDILCDAEKSAAWVKEEIYPLSAISSPSQSSRLNPRKFLSEPQGASCTGYGTLLREISDNFNSSRRGKNMTQLGESTGEPFTIRPREFPIVISESDSDSHAMSRGGSRDEIGTTKIHPSRQVRQRRSRRRVAKKTLAKDGSNVSTEKLESKTDKIVDEK